MKLPDANVLLYAVNSSARHHAQARDWLDGALNGRDSVGFTWIVMLAFLRLSTKAGLFPSPLAVSDALGQVRAWLAQPVSIVLEPTVLHLDVLARLLEEVGAGGNLANDAHLAALAIEHRGEVVSYDSDFGRFPGVVWSRPAGG